MRKNTTNCLIIYSLANYKPEILEPAVVLYIFGSEKGPQALPTLYSLFLLLSDFEKSPKALSVRNPLQLNFT